MFVSLAVAISAQSFLSFLFQEVLDSHLFQPI
jgi:hypothetical protein